MCVNNGRWVTVPLKARFGCFGGEISYFRKINTLLGLPVSPLCNLAFSMH